ncbi:TlpA family protein disulfide reductase [Pedobacter deserti]|uniref:TlpA family protein disulfide reductase n=1 Tax=Pedobacter deserti TaxID=2817382 RepID=UPI00210D52E6|nr:TlpA disulfide reductase family protein [Pedobacter sp. SYSU D00382]
MKKLSLFIFFLFLMLSAGAQDQHPVSWEFSAERTAPLTYLVKLHASVKAPYHIYPQESFGGMGLPTEIIFEAHDNVELQGDILEKGDEQQDGQTLAYFAKGATFSQTIKLKSEDPTSLSFTIKYMACTKQMCLPPSKKQFSLAINHAAAAVDKVDSEKTPAAASAVEGKSQYAHFSMADTEGKMVSSEESVSKSRYTFIDFWASWCAPCRKLGRELIPVYNMYKSQGFNVIGVSLDTDAAAWKKAIQADGYTWTNLSDLKGFESPLSKKHQITAIPRNLLIDREGKIIARDLHGEELVKTIRQLFK